MLRFTCVAPEILLRGERLTPLYQHAYHLGSNFLLREAYSERPWCTLMPADLHVYLQSKSYPYTLVTGLLVARARFRSCLLRSLHWLVYAVICLICMIFCMCMIPTLPHLPCIILPPSLSSLISRELQMHWWSMSKTR